MSVMALFVAFGGWAREEFDGELDAASAEALLKTQTLLKNPGERQKAVEETPQAKWVNQQVESLAGSPENTQAIFELSADILQTLVEKTHGDPNQMKALLDRAKNDPKGFAELLTEKQKKQLRRVSDRIPASKPQTP